MKASLFVLNVPLLNMIRMINWWWFLERGMVGSRSQEQASRSSKYTIRNRILWIETLFHNIATCGIRYSP